MAEWRTAFLYFNVVTRQIKRVEFTPENMRQIRRLDWLPWWDGPVHRIFDVDHAAIAYAYGKALRHYDQTGDDGPYEHYWDVVNDVEAGYIAGYLESENYLSRCYKAGLNGRPKP